MSSSYMSSSYSSPSMLESVNSENGPGPSGRSRQKIGLNGNGLRACVRTFRGAAAAAAAAAGGALLALAASALPASPALPTLPAMPSSRPAPARGCVELPPALQTLGRRAAMVATPQVRKTTLQMQNRSHKKVDLN
mmetsp:Transcript_3985/g.9161  ORF Transcript_3985/g.9161 Transcript_3985/m.9161 type:complete len:136 (-) Transcript_3985:9-416(-)